MSIKQPWEMTLDELEAGEKRLLEELRRCRKKPLHIRIEQEEPLFARLRGYQNEIKRRNGVDKKPR